MLFGKREECISNLKAITDKIDNNNLKEHCKLFSEAVNLLVSRRNQLTNNNVFTQLAYFHISLGDLLNKGEITVQDYVNVIKGLEVIMQKKLYISASDLNTIRNGALGKLENDKKREVLSVI